MPLLLIIMIGPLTAFYHIWEIQLPRVPIIIIGIFVFILGTIFYFKWEFFWYYTYKGQLVTTGIFKHIRHPHYTSLIVIAFGLALFFFSYAAILLATISIPIMVISIMDEERCLLKQYGDNYKEYMKKTRWRMIPKIF